MPSRWNFVRLTHADLQGETFRSARRPAPMLPNHRRLDDRYELVERIGRGGVGDVWRAIDHGFGLARHVCIKRLAPGIDAEHIQDLRAEGALLARLRHANVVSLLGITTDAEGRPALVLELIEGCDLRRLLAPRGRSRAAQVGLPDRVAVHVACALLRALAAVQSAIPGLVHRDVTPHNVLVSTDGEVKLTDFGIALAPLRERRTAPLYVKGKLGYMAPEQARGDALDVRSDLFAVGVVLYELLCGQRPWGDEPGMAELTRIQHGRCTPIQESRSIDRDLAGIVMKLLSHEPKNRPGCAEDALRLLAPFGAGDLGSLRLAHISRTMAHTTSLHAR